MSYPSVMVVRSHLLNIALPAQTGGRCGDWRRKSQEGRLSLLRPNAAVPNRWPAIAAVALGVAIAVRLTVLAVAIHHAQADFRIAAAPAAVRGSILLDSERAQQVVAAHLFGSADKPADQGPAPPQWVLSGVMTGATPESGWAILGESGQATRLLLVGQELIRGYKLAQVLTDRVLIDGRGTRFSLLLPHNRLRVAGSGGKGSDAASSATAAAVLPPLPRVLWHHPKGANAVPTPTQVILRPQAHRDVEGQYDGIQVMGLEGRLAPLGLQRTDVISAVNGQAITSDAEAKKILQQLNGGNTALLTVQRDGVAVQLPLTIAEPGG